jgi:hypothetical protein
MSVHVILYPRYFRACICLPNFQLYHIYRCQQTRTYTAFPHVRYSSDYALGKLKMHTLSNRMYHLDATLLNQDYLAS